MCLGCPNKCPCWAHGKEGRRNTGHEYCVYGEGASDVQIAIGGAEAVNCVDLSCFSVLGFFEAGIYLSDMNHEIKLHRLLWHHFTFSTLSLNIMSLWRSLSGEKSDRIPNWMPKSYSRNKPEPATLSPWLDQGGKALSARALEENSQ